MERFFHEKPSFLHFDIKPQNIIYDKISKNVTIVDFEHSRFGDVSHEIFRGTVAAQRNQYFSYCWEKVKNEFQKIYSYGNLSAKLYFYELFYYLSELTYASFINDTSLIELYSKKISKKLRQY